MLRVIQQTANSLDSYPLFNDQLSEPPVATDDEADKQAHLNKITEQYYQQWPKSRYSNVSVLLLRWATDNLRVIGEVLALEDVLVKDFHFATEQWDIPDEDPEFALTAKIFEFRKAKPKDSLLVLYYAGHGVGGPERCIWSATNSSQSPSLN